MSNGVLLFNFSASSMGGGLKRLLAYAEWFNKNGGANFIIHSKNLEDLQGKFPDNRFFPVQASKYKRLFWDMYYLPQIIDEIGIPNLYYSYGIPMYQAVGKINWFHLTNVLPLMKNNININIKAMLLQRIKFNILGRRIIKNFDKCDVISAESNFSFSLINKDYSYKFFLSVNGNDDELSLFQTEANKNLKDLAVVLGAGCNKRIDDSFKVFEMLRKENPQLKLMIIGDKKFIPNYCKKDKGVIVAGFIKRNEVFRELKQAKYYISTTCLENSYNAAAEGIFITPESYISDIPPHKELLKGQLFRSISIPHIKSPILHIKREEISPQNLRTWDSIIIDMLRHIEKF